MHYPVVVNAHLSDFYDSCKNSDIYCKVYIEGIRQGYARGLFEAKNEILCSESGDVDKLRREVVRILENKEYNVVDNDFFIVIDAINKICQRKGKNEKND